MRSAKPAKGLGDRILKASGAVFLASIVLKLVGFFIKNVIPNHYGLAVSDVFSVVNDNVLNTAFQFGEQCLGPAYMPVFSVAQEKEGEPRAWRFTSVVINLQILILFALMAAMIFFPEPIIGLFTQWDSAELLNDAKAQERRGMAGQMLPYVAPALLGMSLASLTYWILVSYKKFFFAAFGDALLKLSILGGALIGAKISPGNWRALAAGAVAGGSLKLLLHLAVLGRARLQYYQPAINLKDTYFRESLVLVVPLLTGIFVSRYRDAVMGNVLTNAAGLPTLFSMGRGNIDSVHFLIPLSLSIALLPYFCDISARNDNAQLGKLLTQTIRMVAWFFVPLSIVLAASANSICLMLYSGKTITPEMAGLAALVMKIFCIQLTFLAVETMAMQAFFSSRRMIAPTVAGVIFSVLAASTAYLVVVKGGMTDATQIAMTVALCLVLMRVFKSIVLVALLKTTVPVLPFAETAGYFAKLLLASGFAAAAAWGAQLLFAGPLSGVLKAIPGARMRYGSEAILIGVAGAIVYLILSLVLRMDEPRLCLQWTKEKLKQRKSKTETPAPA